MGALLLEKNRVKKFDPRIRIRNSGVQNSSRRIRPQIRVLEVQNPLCRNLSLTTKDFCPPPALGWKFLLRRTWSEQKVLPPQFPGLSLPQ